jgi:hypothetical protein
MHPLDPAQITYFLRHAINTCDSSAQDWMINVGYTRLILAVSYTASPLQLPHPSCISSSSSYPRHAPEEHDLKYRYPVGCTGHGTQAVSETS